MERAALRELPVGSGGVWSALEAVGTRAAAFRVCF